MSIDIETRGRALWVTMNRPEVLNAFDLVMMNGLADAWRRAEADDDIDVLVVTGAGDRAFCSGADVNRLPKEVRALAERGESLPPTIFKDFGITKPIIAAINGHAAGGGLEVALLADLRITVDHATFGLPEVRHGLIPGGGGTQRLPRLIPAGRALELMLLGDSIDAAEALRLGLVSRVVAADALVAEVDGLVERISSFSQPVIRGIKQAWLLGQNSFLDDGLQEEQAAATRVIRAGR